MASQAANTMTEVHVTSVPDICLVLPSGNSEGLKIFASIAVLRNSSTVFHAMLGPHFLEGQTIASNSGPAPPELVLPEDNAQAMQLLLQIIHLQFRDIRQVADHPKFFNKIRGTAILADKYDLCQAMTLTMPMMVTLDQISEMTDQKGLWCILSASYIIGNRETFNASSARLLEHGNVTYYTLMAASTTPCESDMWICTILEEKRAKLRAMVSARLLRGMDEMIAWAEEYSSFTYTQFCETEVPRVAYEDSLEKTRTRLDKYATRLELEYQGIELFNDILRDLDEGLEQGRCFDCVGNRGKHEEHSIKTD